MARARKASTAVALADVVEVTPLKQTAMHGGLEGASRLSRETMRWNPSMRSPDQVINTVKPQADARGRDSVQNDGFAMGAVSLHRDSIVGAQYRLNAKPNWQVIGASEEWAEEFQQVVEPRFNLLAESESCWLDASRKNTLTGQVRLVVGGFVMTGEALGTVEWIKDSQRPYKTAIQLVSPDRLSNPDGQCDTRFLRRGINRDLRGRPLGYYFRKSYPYDPYFDDQAYTWAYVPAEKPWGRKQVIHIIEQLLPDQSRGVADMVSALKEMRMTKNFREITLQNAVVNATYAAAIESELPPELVAQAMGQNSAHPLEDAATQYLGGLSKYLAGATNLAIDGVKIPHLYPGTKLTMQPAGTPGGVGTDFERSLHRYIAAALGLSYEEFARDFSQTSYSSARASMVSTWKSMQSKKKSVADRFASCLYALVLEEMIANGDVPLPPGKTRDHFYVPLMRDAYSQCSWIGAARGQIDELKETQAAILRIDAGLSTYEQEIAKFGHDWRDVFGQRERENTVIKAKNLPFTLQAQRPLGQGQQQADEPFSDDSAVTTTTGQSQPK